MNGLTPDRRAVLEGVFKKRAVSHMPMSQAGSAKEEPARLVGIAEIAVVRFRAGLAGMAGMNYGISGEDGDGEEHGGKVEEHEGEWYQQGEGEGKGDEEGGQTFLENMQ